MKEIVRVERPINNVVKTTTNNVVKSDVLKREILKINDVEVVQVVQPVVEVVTTPTVEVVQTIATEIEMLEVGVVGAQGPIGPKGDQGDPGAGGFTPIAGDGITITPVGTDYTFEVDDYIGRSEVADISSGFDSRLDIIEGDYLTSSDLIPYITTTEVADISAYLQDQIFINRTDIITVSGGLEQLSADVEVVSGAIDDLQSQIDLIDVQQGSNISVVESPDNTWTVSLSACLQNIECINFKLDHIPTGHIEGKLYYDSNDKTLALQTDVEGTTIQIGQEQVVRVVNKTGSMIPNGTVVYINGAQGNRPTIDLADASTTNSASVIGVVTSDIPDNHNGYVTTFGLVRDLDTSAYVEGSILYLSTNPGQFTDIDVTPPNRSVKIGFVVVSHATEGIILCRVNTGVDLNSIHDVLITDPVDGDIVVRDGNIWTNAANINDYTLLTTTEEVSGNLQGQLTTIVEGMSGAYELTGLEYDNVPGISFDNVTRTFTVSGDHNVWYRGTRFEKTTTDILLPDITGTYFIYYDSTGTLVYATSPWTLLNEAPVAEVYWNSFLQDGKVFNERHTTAMNQIEHRYEHLTFGARLQSGGGISGYVLDSDTIANVTFAVGSTTFWDEDIQDVTSGVADGGPYSVWYRNGASEWRWDDTPTLPLLKATNIYYNQNVGGNFQLTELNSPTPVYVNYYVIATNAVDDGTILIPGQVTYTTIGAAQDETLGDLDLGTLLTQIAVEAVGLYKITYVHRNTYSVDTGRVRIAAVENIQGVNIRNVQAVGVFHNQTLGLQGGQIDEYYHLTAAQYADYIGSTEVANISGGLDSRLDVIESTYITTTEVANISGNLQSQIDLKANDNEVVHLTGDENISGAKTFSDDVVVNGNMYVNGTEFVVFTESISAGTNIIDINTEDPGPGITAGFAGLRVHRGLETPYFWGFDETRDAFVVGTLTDETSGSVENLQVTATREDTPTDNGVMTWDSANYKLVNDSNFTYDSTKVDINIDTDSTSTSTGALVVDGGVGIAKSLYVGGKTAVINSELVISSSATGNTHFNYVNGGNNYITRLNTQGTYFRSFNGTNYTTEAQFTSSGLTIFSDTEATSSAGSILTSGGISAAKGGYFGGAITTANSVVITASVPFFQLNDSDSSARDFRCVVNSDKLFFQTDATADSGAFDRNVMTIDGAANAVAIGATTLVASEKLRVAGAINTSGVLTITDTTEATSSAGSILSSGGISAAKGVYAGTQSTIISATSGASSSESVAGLRVGNAGLENRFLTLGYDTTNDRGYIYAIHSATAAKALELRSATIVTSTTDATSTTTGALRVDGGVGIVKRLYVGAEAAGAIGANSVGTIHLPTASGNGNGITFLGSSNGINRIGYEPTFGFGMRSVYDNIVIQGGLDDSNKRTVTIRTGTTGTGIQVDTSGRTLITGTEDSSSLATGALRVSGGAYITKRLSIGYNGGASLDIYNGAISMIIGANNNSSNRNDASQKEARIGIPHYTNAQGSSTILTAFTQASTTLLNIGGGTSVLKAITEGRFYAAANTTTVIGTEVGRWTYNTFNFATGTTVNVDNTTDASSKSTGALRVDGGVGIAGKLHVESIYGGANDKAIAIYYPGTDDFGFANNWLIINHSDKITTSSSGWRYALASVASSSTLARNNMYVIQTTSGITTSIWGSPGNGDIIHFRNKSGGNTTISGNGNNIDGSATRTLASGASITLVYNGTEWVVF